MFNKSLNIKDELRLYINSIKNENTDINSMLAEMSQDVSEFSSGFSDNVNDISEWGHYYFCSDDGGVLRWDIKDRKHHVCTICGKSYTGEPYDSVWVTFYRNEAFQTIRKAAILYYISKEKKWLQIIENIAGFYASNYSKFVPHSKDATKYTNIKDALGAGKIMPQGLNEAIIIVRSAQAFELVWEELSQEFKENIINNFFIPAKELLSLQIDKIHNIPCWLNSAVGSIGVIIDDKKLIEEAMSSGEYSLVRQLREGMTEDGFWYEGSLHYHFFLLEGVLSFLLLASRHGVRNKEIERYIYKMLISPYIIAFDSGRFPNPNDGWPDIGLKTYLHVYDMAVALFGVTSNVGKLLKDIQSDSADRSDIPLSKPYYFNNQISLERLMYNPVFINTSIINKKKTKRTSKLYRLSCFAMLRNKNINVFLKYGHNGPSHAHPDKMNVEVVANGSYLSRDLSNSGYCSRLCNEWHRSSFSHNTVIVDGKNHVSMERGKVISYTKKHIVALAEDVYPGVDFKREIKLIQSGFIDNFIIDSETKHQYYWVFHVDGKVAENDFISCGENILFDKEIKYIIPKYKLVNNNEIKFNFKGGTAKCNIICDEAEMYLCESPDNPGNKTRTTILISKQGISEQVTVVWKIFEKENA